MRLANSILLATIPLWLASVATAQQARRWVIVDQRQDGDAGLGFLSDAEGFERARAAQMGQPATTFQVGGNFTTFLGNVANGDELVIVAHGVIERNMDRSIRRFGFAFGGTPFFRFGGAMGEMPVPAGFANLTNVRVTFNTCFSARDPDGAGPETALTEKLLATMGPAGNMNTVTGFTNTCNTANVCGLAAGGTAAQRTTARNAVAAAAARIDYCRRPPVNRPGTGGAMQPANQRSRAQEIIDMAVGAAGVVPFDLPSAIGTRGAMGRRGYVVPTEGNPPPPKPSFTDPDDIAADDVYEVESCEGDCPQGCGIADNILQGDEAVPVAVEVVAARAGVDGVEIAWSVRGRTHESFTVHRSESAAGVWRVLSSDPIVSGERVSFVDRSVRPGTRYGYVLSYSDASGETFAGETWVSTPFAQLALGDIGPNPGRGDRVVSYMLARAGHAQILLYDVHGRRVFEHEVVAEHAGAGIQVLRTSQLPAGVYTVRLRQGAHDVARKLTIVR
jgi:hypothetical protein